MINFHKKIFYTYSFLYLSLLVGFFFNEDLSQGGIQDYVTHKIHSKIMNEGIINSFLNYDTLPHSPIYLLYFSTINNLFGDFLARFINLHFVLLIPLFTYLSLSIKVRNIKNEFIVYLPVVFFISPYFRSGAFWIDEKILAITFLSISLYFFLRNNKIQNDNIFFIFLNNFFLAIAAYIQPIFALFGIYFFVYYLIKHHLTKIFFYYVIFNLFLVFPAFYYVVILGINEWFMPYVERGISINIFTIFSVSISILFFYSLPFLCANLSKFRIYFFNIYIFSYCLLFLFLLFNFFNYGNPASSGGVFFKLSNLLFKNNYFFFLCSTLSLYFFIIIFKKFYSRDGFILDITLFAILVILGIHGRLYHEIYDPLFYILTFLLINNHFYSNIIDNFTFKKLIFFIIFSLLFLSTSVLKTQFVKPLIQFTL